MSGIREIYVHLKVRISMFKANKKKQELFYFLSRHLLYFHACEQTKQKKQSWDFYCFFGTHVLHGPKVYFCIGQKRERDGKRVSNNK